MDASISKSFKFKERLTTQFRAEFFNVLNHPNFVNPYGGPGGNAASLDPSGANTSSTGFGFVRATPDQAGSNPVLGSGGARSIQLGLKSSSNRPASLDPKSERAGSLMRPGPFHSYSAKAG